MLYVKAEMSIGAALYNIEFYKLINHIYNN